MLKQIKEAFFFIWPQSRKELSILLGSMFFYLSYSMIIIFETSAIDSKYCLVDVYFSFDNPTIYHYGYDNVIGHPLLKFFTLPTIHLGNLLATLFGSYKAKTLFLALICNFFISMSVVYVVRYLNRVVELKKSYTIILLLFFLCSSTNLILSFTPESFTISAFLLSYMVCYYSCQMKQGKLTSLPVYIVLNILTGGITITNFAKSLLPILFTEKSFKKMILWSSIACCVFAVIAYLCFWNIDFVHDLQFRLYHFKNKGDGVFGQTIFFLGSSILFSGMYVNKGFIGKDKSYAELIEFISYQYVWQYLFVGVLCLLLLLALYKNYKNKYVHYVFLLFFVDVFIHLIYRYGIHEAFIYGGHWIYCVPLLLGWLYKSLKTKYSNGLFITTCCILAVLAVNNGIRLWEFISLAKQYYPPY